MPKRTRPWDPEDALRSDSNDESFDDTRPPSRSKATRQPRKSKSATRRAPKHRRRASYDDSEENVESDSDAISDEASSRLSDAEATEHVELNPRTGRSIRAAAKKRPKYEEISEEDSGIEGQETEDQNEKAEDTSVSQKRPPVSHQKKSRIVVLPVRFDLSTGMPAAPGTRRPSKKEPTPRPRNALATRRSSRISHNDERPLVELTGSGKHEEVVRPGTATPEPLPSRRSGRSNKGLKKPPSPIVEASEEGQAGDPEPITKEISAGTNGQQGDLVEVERAAQSEERIDVEAVDEDEQVVQESVDEEQDEAPVSLGGRGLRSRRKATSPPTSQQTTGVQGKLRGKKSAGPEPSSDFEPDADPEADIEENVSDTDEVKQTAPVQSSNDESRGSGRPGRLKRKAPQQSRSRRQQSDDEELDEDEIADEAADLAEDRKRQRRESKRPSRSTRNTQISFEPNLRSRGTRPDYRILRPEFLAQAEEDEQAAGSGPAATPTRNRRTGGGAAAGAYRSLFSTYGPFGGAGGPPPVLGESEGVGATGGVDSDSSDDEGAVGARGGQGVGGALGMTPTSAFPKPFVPQVHNADSTQGAGGGPPGLGKVKDKKSLADADPLGVDPNVSFEGVGGLDDHINQLKEMVALPLLYPEVFQQFHITPPRGVLFHGPPGTGKTLLARALASSVSSGGKKVTFYMRKGADALSKWVGEAEKQLRMLFEEARRNQPSIIFFDEIDGLAPVRSSKQEQIHASIVATLLALMDGMDGRGQVIVIGATNRPDSVDPALRRPGRFDREFYFPLPDEKARRSIIDIHTKGWSPSLKTDFKDQLAELTRGYGGADLRALCTEAALNAVQGTFPQIYSSNKKLVIDPSQIKVLAKDFMISVNKIVPSSERSAASGAVPLRKDVEPLLRTPLRKITDLVNHAIPRKRKATALEEAMYDDREDEYGFEKETLQRHFESSRIFRPRLLIRGIQGMGQQYLGAALLSKLEGLHVQSFDLATLMRDSGRSPEAAIVQQFEEVKRHKPSVIFIPNVDVWYDTLSESAVRTFTGLLRSLAPTDPILLLGIMETAASEPEKEPNEHHMKAQNDMLRDLFGYSEKNQFLLKQPEKSAREEYFGSMVEYIRRAPSAFPDAGSRKRRKLAELPLAPEIDEPQGPSKAEIKAQRKKDRQTLNMLKLHIQVVMDQVKMRYKKFRLPVIDEKDIAYLYAEQDPQVLTTDLSEEQREQQQLFRPFELDKDEKGVPGLRQVASGKFFYNLETVTIEKRLSNGYYKRPKDFLADIKRLAKDSKTSGDQDRTLKANEMLANVEVDIAALEQQQQPLTAECEALHAREQAREAERVQKSHEAVAQGETVPRIVPNLPPPEASKTTTEGSGPLVLGQEVPGVRPPLLPGTPSRMHPNRWSLPNGSAPSYQTNGSTVPSRPPQQDTEVIDSQDAGDHRNPRPQAASSPQDGMQGILSQRSAHTKLAHGSQVEQYQNSASTTTSGQKTTDKSNRSSGPYSNNTQLSNGARPPDFSMLGEHGGSQLPDTQEPQYSSSQSKPPPSSQTMPPPAPPAPHHPRSSPDALLNSPADPAEASSPPPLIVCHDSVNEFHQVLVDKCSGLSVEQLEQVHAAMMEVIWRERGDWNRDRVLVSVQKAFNDTIEDIEKCQPVLTPSQLE